MTDTPPITTPPSRLDQIKAFIGDLARPFAIIISSAGGAWASVVAAYRVDNGNDGALLLGAIFAGISAIYIGKAWEVAKTGKHSAQVEIAKVGGPAAGNTG
ncbi:MAG TPA: hypothetical protein VEA44_10605 [Caulobacter sp.]|nr:hypothetical protein [Caulobacter sp.]